MSLPCKPLPKALVHLCSRHSLQRVHFYQLLNYVLRPLRNVVVNILKMPLSNLLEEVILMPRSKGIITLQHNEKKNS